MPYPIKYYFFIRKSAKTGDTKLKPLYLRIQINGERKDVSIGKKVRPSEFDSDYQRVSKSSDRSHVNIVLSSIENQIEKMTINLREDQHVDLNKFVDNLFLKHSNKGVLEIFTEHNEKMESLVGKEYSKNTLKKYQTGYRNLQRFLNEIRGEEDIPCYEIDIDFLEDYDYHLRVDRGCKHNTTLKYIFQFRKIVRLAIKEGLLKTNPFLEYDKTYKETKPTFLTSKELKKMGETTFEIDRLENIRQMFLLACYTGLSYSDLMKLEKDDVFQDSEENWFIVQPRTKTSNVSSVMLIDEAIPLVMEFLSDNLNRVSNQKFNSYLKEIADLCGITKHLTVHVARHTFATTVALDNGVPLETVKHLMGHKDLRSTQHYARVTTSKVKKEMSRISL